MNMVSELANAPVPIEPAPAAFPRKVEYVKALFLQCEQKEATVQDIPLRFYEEGSRPIPDLQFLLGDPNAILNIPIRHGPPGVLGRPYHMFFQGFNPNGGRQNACVLAMTHNSPKYQWFGNIVVLKFDGIRERRYIDVSSNETLNLTHFFAEQSVRGQPD